MEFTVKQLPVATGTPADAFNLQLQPGAPAPGEAYAPLAEPTPQQMEADRLAIEARKRGLPAQAPEPAMPGPGLSLIAPAEAADTAPQFTIKDVGPVSEAEIDTRRGAPASVRHAVGGAPSRDRLATLRQFYPDAQPHGPENFVFTDPKTGQKTLYNPKGLDFGDLTSVLPELAEFGGGAAGGAAAALGATAAAPATGGLSYLSVPVGYGLGAAGGRELENTLATWLAKRLDTRGVGEHLANTGTTALANATGGRVGELVGQGIKNVVGPVASYAARKIGGATQAVRDFAALGVTPSAGAATGNRAMQMVEKGLSNLPGSAGIMQRQAETQLQQIHDAADDLARRFGPVRTKQGAGEALQGAARRGGERFADRRELLDTAIERAIGPDTPAAVPNAKGLYADLFARRAAAPASRERDLGPAIDRLEALIRDATRQGNDAVPFAALRSIRTALGRDLERPDISGYSPASEAAMRRVYAALSEDIRAAARSAGPDAERALARHDRYVRFIRAERGAEPGPLARLQALEDAGTPEQAFNYAMTLAKEGGSRLYALRRSMPAEDWNVVAGTVLGRMGQATPGQQGATLLGDVADDFSVATFLTNWNKLSAEAKSALFGGTQYATLRPELDQLVGVVARLKDADKMANPSGTARNLFVGMGILAAGNDVVEGKPGQGAEKLALGIIAPRVAARLITSPDFVHWLAGAARAAQGNPNGLGAQIMRLGAIAEAEPAIRESIAQYIDALRATPAPPAGASAAAPGSAKR
jgi:hypothetical protein